MEASKRLFDFTYLHAVFIVGAVVCLLLKKKRRTVVRNYGVIVEHAVPRG